MFYINSIELRKDVDMLQNIFGCVIVLAFAAIFFRISSLKNKKKDYSQYLTTNAYVLQTLDDKWVVEITEENGEKALGMDDQVCFGTFNQDVPKVKKRTVEKVYYWPYDRKNSRYALGGQEMKYSIHFCNPEYEKFRDKQLKRSSTILRCVGVVLTCLAIVVLFFGNETT